MSLFTPESITVAIYDRDATEFGVTWQTDDRGTPVLEFTDTDDVDFVRATRIKGECSDSTDTVKNCAVLRGLKPGEKYLWRVGDESGVFSESAVLFTPNHDPDRLAFLNMTDSQDGENRGAWWKYAWQDAFSRCADLQFVVHTGDIVQEGGNAEMWRQMTGMNSELFCSIPMAPTAGNHDYWYGYLHGYDAVTEKHFCIDLPPQDTRHGIYYSFDCGPAHFTVLNSGDSMETEGTGLLPEQLEWAERDIASTTKRWKIVAVHNPLYSPGKYGCRDPIYGQALGMRRQLDEMFVKYGVDLVLCGHDHVFARTYPIGADSLPITDYPCDNGVIDGVEAKIAVDPQGPIHLESGCAGNQNRGIEDDIKEEFARCFEEMSAMTHRAVAHSVIEIDGDTMTISYRENSVDNGECVKKHAFGIRKSNLSEK